MLDIGKNMLKLDVKGFDEYIAKLEDLQADLKPIVSNILNEAGQTIEQDTVAGVSDQYLPAHGKYHHAGHPTEASIVRNARTTWSGSIAEIGVGFDFDKPGAGGYLITGTPRMAPDKELNKIYKSKRYMNGIRDKMIERFKEEVDRRINGG